jgi:N utilization substance protein B
MSNRRKLREAGIQILYGLDFYDMDPEAALAHFRTHFGEELADDGFLGEVIRGVHRHRESIDNLIRQFSTNWRLERMAIVDRNILRFSTFELLHLGDIPRKVCINEAIEVAKKYGGDDSPSFINGILDRIALEVRGPETDQERELAASSAEAPPAAEEVPQED